MIKKESACVGCEVCYGCGADKSSVIICDHCKDEIMSHIRIDGMELCENCYKNYVKNLYYDEVFAEFNLEINKLIDATEVIM